MRVKIIIPLENMTVSVGTKIADFIVLPSYYIFLKDNSNLIKQYGIDFKENLESKHVLYYEGETSKSSSLSHFTSLREMIEALSNYFTFFFELFWLTKDTSAYISDIFMENSDANSFIRYSNFFVASNKACECSETHFSVEEIAEGEKRYDKVIKYLNRSLNSATAVPTFTNGIQPNLSAFMNYTFNRIIRAYDFLNSARDTFIPVIKITFYVAIYECLFTSSSSEMTHQVSERASLFIGGTKEEKQGNYNLLKEAYSIRSRYIHGDTINKGREYFLSILDPLDELTRTVFNKVLNEPNIFLLSSSEGDKKKFEQYFKDLIFS